MRPARRSVINLASLFATFSAGLAVAALLASGSALASYTTNVRGTRCAPQRGAAWRYFVTSGHRTKTISTGNLYDAIAGPGASCPSAAKTVSRASKPLLAHPSGTISVTGTDLRCEIYRNGNVPGNNERLNICFGAKEGEVFFWIALDHPAHGRRVEPHVDGPSPVSTTAGTTPTATTTGSPTTTTTTPPTTTTTAVAPTLTMQCTGSGSPGGSADVTATLSSGQEGVPVTVTYTASETGFPVTHSFTTDSTGHVIDTINFPQSEGSYTVTVTATGDGATGTCSIPVGSPYLGNYKADSLSVNCNTLHYVPGSPLTVDGSFSPSSGGTPIVIYYYPPGSGAAAQHDQVTTAANGSFTDSGYTTPADPDNEELSVVAEYQGGDPNTPMLIDASYTCDVSPSAS